MEDETKRHLMFEFLEKFDLINDLEEILTLVIVKGKYSLTRKMINHFKIPFDVVYVKAALEYSKIDIVFLLRVIYPLSFYKHEKLYISSLIISFEKCNINWLAKIYLFKSMIDQTSYTKAEQVCLHILKVIESNDPSANPYYFTPNALLFS